MMQPRLPNKNENTPPEVFLAENPEATEPQSLGSLMAGEATFFSYPPLD
jgi:hypothetical protein